MLTEDRTEVLAHQALQQCSTHTRISCFVSFCSSLAARLE